MHSFVSCQTPVLSKSSSSFFSSLQGLFSSVCFTSKDLGIDSLGESGTTIGFGLTGVVGGVLGTKGNDGMSYGDSGKVL